MKSIKKCAIIKEDEERMFSEMNILKNLDHPNIIKLIDNFSDSLSCYLITEFCNGWELFDKVVNQIYLKEKQAANIIKQLLSAIDFCHKKHIGDFIYLW